MTTTSFLLPIEFDLAATFLMAMTGVWAASRRGYDVIGAFTLAFVSGVGGGLLRDSVFLSQPPAVMQNPLYLFAVLAAVLIGVLFYRAALRFERLMAYVDAIALAVYAVVGADKALAAGYAPVGAVLIGMTNAVGRRVAARYPGSRRTAAIQARSVLCARGPRGLRAVCRAAAPLWLAGAASRLRLHRHHAAAAPARHPLQLANLRRHRVAATLVDSRRRA